MVEKERKKGGWLGGGGGRGLALPFSDSSKRPRPTAIAIRVAIAAGPDCCELCRRAGAAGAGADVGITGAEVPWNAAEAKTAKRDFASRRARFGPSRTAAAAPPNPLRSAATAPAAPSSPAMSLFPNCDLLPP